MKRFCYETSVIFVAAVAVFWFRITGRQFKAADVWADAMNEIDEGIEAQFAERRRLSNRVEY